MTDEPKVGEWWWVKIDDTYQGAELVVAKSGESIVCKACFGGSLVDPLLMPRQWLVCKIDDPRLLTRLIRWVKGWFR